MTRKSSKQYFVDVNDMLQLNADCHVYLIDKKGCLLEGNLKQMQVIQQITGINTHDKIVGTSVDDLFTKRAANIVHKENTDVIKGKKAKLFYNVWVIENFKQITFLTMKTPLYNERKQIIGVFGISQYLSEHTLENSNQIELSNREAECLDYLLRGKTSKEIAYVTKLSVRTIEGYLTNIKRKLKCYSKSALISKALKFGPLKLNKFDGVVSKNYESGIFMPKE